MVGGCPKQKKGQRQRLGGRERRAMAWAGERTRRSCGGWSLKPKAESGRRRAKESLVLKFVGMTGQERVGRKSEKQKSKLEFPGWEMWHGLGLEREGRTGMWGDFRTKGEEIKNEGPLNED